MRSIKLVDEVYELHDNFVWVGPDSVVVDILNHTTQKLIVAYGPAHGDPRAYVYETILQRYPIFKKAINDEKIIYDRNVLY